MRLITNLLLLFVLDTEPSEYSSLELYVSTRTLFKKYFSFYTLIINYYSLIINKGCIQNDCFCSSVSYNIKPSYNHNGNLEVIKL